MRALTEDAQRPVVEELEFFFTGGSASGQSQVLAQPLIRIGSATDNDLVLNDRTVSRHHAEIRATPQGPMLRDLDSTNGTYVGQMRITEAYLTDEVLCLLGQTRLIIRRSGGRRSDKTRQPAQHLGQLVGASARMRDLYEAVRMIAPTSTTVLIHGESGCGKELVARTLHELSGRSGPLVVFDASVTDPEMVRNDLFGHVKGAFTGAAGSR
ncbi:MAG: FHA domain-containing protein, partial [Candidatus Competibacterales bacterium]|nr:FHA domain-containing protein [Candidatus Competibacterales bacterium]